MWIRRLTFNALLCLLKRNSGTKLLQLPPRALPLSFLESPMIMLQHWLAPRGCEFDVVAVPQSANGLLPARLPPGLTTPSAKTVRGVVVPTSAAARSTPSANVAVTVAVVSLVSEASVASLG